MSCTAVVHLTDDGKGGGSAVALTEYRGLAHLIDDGKGGVRPPNPNPNPETLTLTPRFVLQLTWARGRGGKVGSALDAAGVGESTGAGGAVGRSTLLATPGVGDGVSKRPFSSTHPQVMLVKSPTSSNDTSPSPFESPYDMYTPAGSISSRMRR